MKTILCKMRGGQRTCVAVEHCEVLRAWCGSTIAMTLIGLMHYFIVADMLSAPLLIGSFGASAVLCFGATSSPLAQPRNLVGGHVISALVGVTVCQFIGAESVLSVSLAVPLAIAAMLMTGTLHPPGGATALTAVTGGQAIYSLGYGYVLIPCLLGTVILLVTALVCNNMSKRCHYPLYWR